MHGTGMVSGRISQRWLLEAIQRGESFVYAERADEKDLHRRLAEYRIAGTREYYYPYPEVLPVINEMREWMGIRPLRRRDLPRLARCTFHRRVMEARAKGTSVFTSRG